MNKKQADFHSLNLLFSYLSTYIAESQCTFANKSQNSFQAKDPIYGYICEIYRKNERQKEIKNVHKKETRHI